ncbi:hypothetical protein [Pedobacter arcticus]|uniref:hypothetical protein n=1 Tax=Pedobacter arcticus TaxID=752140 RepID=UPI0002DC0340|nr:hypothetical protein [Pedobacter arcticus]
MKIPNLTIPTFGPYDGNGKAWSLIGAREESSFFFKKGHCLKFLVLCFIGWDSASTLGKKAFAKATNAHRTPNSLR